MEDTNEEPTMTVQEAFQAMHEQALKDLKTSSEMDFQQLAQANYEAMVELAQKFNAQVQPLTMHAVRLQCIVDMLFNPEERHELEKFFEFRMGQQIAGARREVEDAMEKQAQMQRQAMLLEGVGGSMPPGPGTPSPEEIAKLFRP